MIKWLDNKFVWQNPETKCWTEIECIVTEGERTMEFSCGCVSYKSYLDGYLPAFKKHVRVYGKVRWTKSGAGIYVQSFRFMKNKYEREVQIC